MYDPGDSTVIVPLLSQTERIQGCADSIGFLLLFFVFC